MRQTPQRAHRLPAPRLTGTRPPRPGSPDLRSEVNALRSPPPDEPVFSVLHSARMNFLVVPMKSLNFVMLVECLSRVDSKVMLTGNSG